MFLILNFLCVETCKVRRLFFVIYNPDVIYVTIFYVYIGRSQGTYYTRQIVLFLNKIFKNPKRNIFELADFQDKIALIQFI